jgi:hypothetical protein
MALGLPELSPLLELLFCHPGMRGEGRRKEPLQGNLIVPCRRYSKGEKKKQWEDEKLGEGKTSSSEVLSFPSDINILVVFIP